jgi:hypothetical protein
VKAPIWGTYFDSLMKAIFVPSSMSVSPKAFGSSSAGKIDRIVRWRDRAPVELDSRSRGIDFRRRPVHAAEDVKLVMVQIDRHGIVGLIRRPLRPQPRRGHHA